MMLRDSFPNNFATFMNIIVAHFIFSVKSKLTSFWLATAKDTAYMTSAVETTDKIPIRTFKGLEDGSESIPLSYSSNQT